MQRLRNILRIATQPLGNRHQPTGLNTEFNGSGLSFAQYVATTRDMLGETRAKAEMRDGELQKIVDGNAPFELKPALNDPAGRTRTYRRGIALTHGLTDSPYSMRHLASFFHEQGFRVMVLLLPGHGTQPGDLLDVRWQEWAKAVAYVTDKLAEECEEVYLGGKSTGGTLSVYQSLQDARIRGLFLFSPAIRITPLAALANVYKLFSWLKPSAKWLTILPDTDIYRYESFPNNAAAQVYALTKATKQLLKMHGLAIPVFCAASEDDMTVSISGTLAIMARASHPANKLVLYTTAPERFRCEVPAGKLELVYSVVPEQNILSSAHTAIVLSAEDEHYGINGEYSNCMHYYPGDMKSYGACMQNPQRLLQGEFTDRNLRVGLLRRLMYNPNFSALKDTMRRFIGNLP